MLVTLQLVLVVLATVDVPLPAVAPPLLVGLAVSLGHLVAVSPAHHQQIIQSQILSVKTKGRISIGSMRESVSPVQTKKVQRCTAETC